MGQYGRAMGYGWPLPLYLSEKDSGLGWVALGFGLVGDVSLEIVFVEKSASVAGGYWRSPVAERKAMGRRGWFWRHCAIYLG
jgi:hypothetical protein